MASVPLVTKAVKDAVWALLVNQWGAFPPAQIDVGIPYAPALSEILGEGGAQLSVYPLTKAAQNRTGFKPHWVQVSPPDVELFVTIYNPNVAHIPPPPGSLGHGVPLTVGIGWNVIFYGTPVPNLNIHVLISNGSNPVTDFHYTTVEGDTVFSIASNIVSMLLAANWDQLTAEADGTSISLNGILSLQVNIGGQATMVQEVRRTMLPVQVSVWAPTADLRNQIGQLIEDGLGTAFPVPFLRASDGAAIWIRMRGAPDWGGDVAQSSYSLYEWHGVFECEYPTYQITTATQIEAIGTTVNDNNN